MVTVDNSGARILVVDDDPALLGFTCKYLSKLGYAVVPYRSSEEAWKHFETSGDSYSLVLIDLSMPALSGEELSRMILNVNPRIGLILASGYPFDTEALPASERIAFLHKPFTPAMLTQTVARLIRDGQKNNAD